jgi:hypothetical protein
MPPIVGILILLGVVAFILGFTLGYGIRAGISRRHRAQAQLRYNKTGSYR